VVEAHLPEGEGGGGGPREDPGRYGDLLGTMEEVSVLAAHGKRLRCRELEGRERGAG
jgi:hypothetical protein